MKCNQFLTLLLCLFSFSSNANAFTEEARVAVQKIVNDQDHILIDYLPKSKNRSITPGSYVYFKRGGGTKQNGKRVFGFLCTPEFSTFRQREGYEVYQSRVINQGLFWTLKTRFEYVGNRLIKEISRFGSNSLSKNTNQVVVNIGELTEYYLFSDGFDLVTREIGPKCRKTIQGNVATGNAYVVMSTILFSVDYEFYYNRATPPLEKIDFRGILKYFFRSNEVEDIKGRGFRVKGNPLVYGVKLKKVSF